MYYLLDITRPSYYYKEVESVFEAPLEDKVKETFLENKAQFGTRKNQTPPCKSRNSALTASNHEVIKSRLCLLESYIQTLFKRKK